MVQRILPKRACFSIIFLTILGQGGVVIAQSYTTADTVFTPPDYPDGDLMGTLFLPASPNGTGIVAVHELGTDRSTMDIWCDTLAAHGYTTMTIDYPDPVNGGATFPSPERAVIAATRFLRSYSNASLQRVGVLGRSLGAILGAGAVMDANTYGAIDPSYDSSTHIDFAVLLYGMYDFQHFLTSKLPLSLFLSNYFMGDNSLESSQEQVLHSSQFSCPILLVHGTKDSTLQYQQSVSFYDSLKQNGKDADLILVPDAGHVFETNGDSFTVLGLPIKDSVLSFLSQSKLVVTNPNQVSISYVYPNPCFQGYSLHLSTNIHIDHSVKFTSAIGIETILEAHESLDGLDINTQSLHPGTYYISVPGMQPTPITILP